MIPLCHIAHFGSGNFNNPWGPFSINFRIYDPFIKWFWATIVLQCAPKMDSAGYIFIQAWLFYWHGIIKIIFKQIHAELNQVGIWIPLSSYLPQIKQPTERCMSKH